MAAEMLIKTFKTIDVQIDTIDKCECCVYVCSSFCPSVCHTFVSVTYLPNVWFD